MCEISEFIQLNRNGQGVSQDNIGLKVNHEQQLCFNTFAGVTVWMLYFLVFQTPD